MGDAGNNDKGKIRHRNNELILIDHPCTDFFTITINRFNYPIKYGGHFAPSLSLIQAWTLLWCRVCAVGWLQTEADLVQN